jgi:GAF domain
VVDGVLRLVVDLARSCVHGADGVSVSLLRNGEFSTVAASDQTIMTMDAEQYATGEGPCVDASIKGRLFHAESLDTEIRWPTFTPKARVLGIRAILSSPLTAFEAPFGALNLYSRTGPGFDVNAQETAVIFAQKASIILSDVRVDMGKAQMAFQEALRVREAICLTTGINREHKGLGDDRGLELCETWRRSRRIHSNNERRKWCAPIVRCSILTGDAMTDPALDVLDTYRQAAGLSHGDLWLRYFELGGMNTGIEVEAILHGALAPSYHDHEVIALALNERFAELGRGHPVPYARVSI